ncbi:hypothetical protein KSP39_PZI024441 [Platanthera zijinensis]|uniref:Oxidative stress 3 n=1 Tax=Platanthera zijinensis TaxID=2320716 RepID=A0AAP0FT69_9ASPA
MAAILESKPFGILSFRAGEDYDDDCELSESISGDFSESVFSEEDDASSYSSSSSSSPCSSFSNSSAGPLYDLSSLMEDLPIKKGLSKFFKGKSQSFISLSQVRCIEELAKKESPYSKRMSSRRRNGVHKKPHYPPNHVSRTISKRSKSNSFSCISKSPSAFTEQKKYLHAFIKEKQGEAYQK